MILVRNSDMDADTLCSLLQPEAKGKGTVKDNTVTQYLNKMRGWAKALYEADVRRRAASLPSCDTEAQDITMSNEEKNAEKEFQKVVKTQFSSIKFEIGDLNEVIDLGARYCNVDRARDAAKREKEKELQRKREVSEKLTDNAEGRFRTVTPPFNRSSASLSSCDEVESTSTTSKKKKLAPVFGDETDLFKQANEARLKETNGLSNAISSAMLEYGKISAKQNDTTATMVSNTLTGLFQMQTEAADKREERERKREEQRAERDRLDRKREKREHLELLATLLGKKKKTKKKKADAATSDTSSEGSED